MAIFTGTGISEADIDNLAGKFSVTFPDDYSDFLKHITGSGLRHQTTAILLSIRLTMDLYRSMFCSVMR